MNLAIDVAQAGAKPTEELVGRRAIKSLFLNDDVNLILVGKEKSILRALSKLKYDRNRIDIKHTNQIIDMNESPASGNKT